MATQEYSVLVWGDTASGFTAALLGQVDEDVIQVPGIGSPEGLIELLDSWELAKGPANKITREYRGRQRVLLLPNELSTVLRKCRQEATSGLGPASATGISWIPAPSMKPAAKRNTTE